MSELWYVKVEKKEDTDLTLKVYTIHPDAGSTPASKEFILALIAGPAYDLKFDYLPEKIVSKRVPNCPLGELIPFEESYIEESLTKYVDKVIKEVKPVRAVNFPWPSEEEYEDEEFEGPYPCVTFEIKVTSPKYIEHLKPGMSFDSAAYSYKGPRIAENFETET